MLLFAIAFVSIGGCGYPRVSESALRLAQAIDTVANLRDPAQIPKARKVVEARFSAGEIDESERDMLLSILDRAEEGDWEGAEANARALLRAQNGGSRPLRTACSCCEEEDAGATSAQNEG